MLAKQLADAAREEIAHDKTTGQPYRVNHALPVRIKDGKQLHLWIDIDEAERGPMLKSLVMRREQMVGDGLQLKLDEQHWNSIHEGDEPIDLPMDLDFDIQLRMNQAKDDDDDERGGGGAEKPRSLSKRATSATPGISDRFAGDSAFERRHYQSELSHESRTSRWLTCLTTVG